MKHILATTCAFAIMTTAAIGQTPTPANPGASNATAPQTTQTPAAAPTSNMGKQPAQAGAASSAGLQRVDAASLVMTYYTANPADTRVSNIMGRSVYNLRDEAIGEVNDIIINNGKTITAIVVGVGGFLGMGERNVAVAPSAIVLSETNDGSARLVVNTTKEDLKKATAFNFDDVDKPKAGSTTSMGTGKPATK